MNAVGMATGTLRVAAVLAAWLISAAAWGAGEPPAPGSIPPPTPAAYGPVTGSDTARQFAQRVREAADAQGLPFAIVDKQAALILVYRADGSLAATSPVLLGLTPGDQSVPGVRERTQSGRLRSDDRTTPAGRFASEPGRNLSGEAIVWVDYDMAFAIHRLRPGPSGERRAQRLASAKLSDRRISAGCVVVPEAFYDSVIGPLLGHSRGVVYVLPEDGPWQDLWKTVAAGNS